MEWKAISGKTPVLGRGASPRRIAAELVVEAWTVGRGQSAQDPKEGGENREREPREGRRAAEHVGATLMAGMSALCSLCVQQLSTGTTLTPQPPGSELPAVHKSLSETLGLMVRGIENLSCFRK